MTDKYADIRERYFGPAKSGEYIEDRTVKEDIRRLLDEVEQLKKKIKILTRVEIKLHDARLGNERLRIKVGELMEENSHLRLIYGVEEETE